MHLGIAEAAFGLALASLGWQSWTWFQTKPRLVVSTTTAVEIYRKDDQSTVWAAMPGKPGQPTQVTVTALNRGRAAVSVTGWGFTSDYGDFRDAAQASAIAVRLEPNSQETWMMSSALLRQLTTTTNPHTAMKDVRPFVEAGLGRVHGHSPPDV